MTQIKMKKVTGISFILCFLVLYATAERFINDNDYSKGEKDDRVIAVRGIFTERRMERESRLINTRGRVGSERLVNNRRIVDSDLRRSNFISNVNNIRRKNENTLEIRRRYDTERVGKVDSVNTRRLNENNFENLQRRPDINLAPRVIRDLMSEETTRSRDNKAAFSTTRVRALETRTADNIQRKNENTPEIRRRYDTKRVVMVDSVNTRQLNKNNFENIQKRVIRDVMSKGTTRSRDNNDAFRNTRVRALETRKADNIHSKTNKFQITEDRRTRNNLKTDRYIRIGSDFRHMQRNRNLVIQNRSDRRINIRRSNYQVTPYIDVPQTIIRERFTSEINSDRTSDDSRRNWNLEISHIKLKPTLQREQIPHWQINRKQQNSLGLRRADTSLQRRNLAVSNKIRFDDEDTAKVVNRRTMSKRETFIAIRKQEKLDKAQNLRRIFTQNSERVQHAPNFKKITNTQTFKDTTILKNRYANTVDENNNRTYKNYYLNQNYTGVDVAWSSIISTLAAILFIGQIIHSNRDSKRFNSIQNVFIPLKEKVY